MFKIFTCLFIAFFVLVFYISGQTVTDIDNNNYNTITIGSQEWMKENLKTSRYSNGDIIPTTGTIAGNDSTSKFQWFYEDDSLTNSVYGRLYTWYAVKDVRNVCPAGWHVPDELEWITLSDFLGGDSVAGLELKETGAIYWLTTDSNVMNSTGFSGLGGGLRGNPSGFIGKNNFGLFWSSTAWGSSSFQRANLFKLQANYNSLEETVAVANCGLSVRCIKDITSNTQNGIHKLQINIYPNPATDFINIHRTTSSIATVHIKLTDHFGRTAFENKYFNNSDQISIDVRQFSAGVYHLSLIVGSESIDKNIIVLRPN
jgi:uncharacterized protein (TIGR02145 family)